MDKKKQQIIIMGSLIGVIAIVAIIFFMMRGGDTTEAAVDVTTPEKKVIPGGGQPPTATAGVGGGQTASTPTAADSAPAAGGAKNGKIAQVTPLSGHKSDPFYYVRHIVTPPPNVFDSGIEPVRMALTFTPERKTGGQRVRVVPNRRVSGLMSGDGVYAILENTNGDVEIVKPGSRTKDGYIVTAINPESVELEQEDPQTHVIYTQTVMFSDAPVSSTPQGPGGPNGPNGPGGGRPRPPGGPPGGPPGSGG